jgi:hypothetical protein
MNKCKCDSKTVAKDSNTDTFMTKQRKAFQELNLEKKPDKTDRKGAMFITDDLMEAVAASHDVAEAELDDLLESVRKEMEFRSKKNVNFGVYDDVDDYITDDMNTPSACRMTSEEYIEDIMTYEEYAAYLKGNVLKYITREPRTYDDVMNAKYYLDTLIGMKG